MKTGDAELARVQALMDDPVAPLICLLHACDDDDTPIPISIDEAKEAVMESIQLLGNRWACPNSDKKGYIADVAE